MHDTSENMQVGAHGGHKSTQRVLAVLDLLTTKEAGLSAAEIGRTLSIPKGTLSPILHTMVHENFLSQDTNTGDYSLGLKTYLAGKSVERRSGDLALVQPVMDRIVEACGETCQLAVLDGTDALYVAKAISPAPVQLVTDIGKRLPLYCTAVGKAMLSTMTPDQVAKRLPDTFVRHTAQTVAGREELFLQLEETRLKGYAHETGEVLDDVECYAVAVPKDGTVRFGLGVSTPRYRMNEAHRNQIIDALLQAQRELSERL